jgi:hypothetical protein
VKIGLKEIKKAVLLVFGWFDIYFLLAIVEVHIYDTFIVKTCTYLCIGGIVFAANAFLPTFIISGFLTIFLYKKFNKLFSIVLVISLILGIGLSFI